MLQKFMQVSGLSLLASFLISVPVIANPSPEQSYMAGYRSFNVFPKTPSLFHPVVLTTEVTICGFFEIEQRPADTDSDTIDISITGFGFDFSPCPPVTFQLNIPVERIDEVGIYQINIYESYENDDPFGAANFLGSFALAVEDTGPQYWVETPAAESLQSGVGIIRGWACEAESVGVQFEGMSRQKVAYGSARADTMEVCGDENNGYSLAIAWGSLGLGSHRMRTFIDDVEVADVEFEVVGLNEPFIRGLSGTFEIDDFPEVGQSVTLQWSEPDQNFIIVDYSP